MNPRPAQSMDFPRSTNEPHPDVSRIKNHQHSTHKCLAEEHFHVVKQTPMIRIRTYIALKSGGLCAAALLAGSLTSSLAGEIDSKSTSDSSLFGNAPAANVASLDDGKDVKDLKAPEPPEPANPLSFFDGKVVLDIQERLRWENRSNNYDFNSAVRSPTDGNWFENRFRFGVTVQPVDWFTFYAQGQSSIEFNGHRATIPGTNAAEGDDYFNLRQAYVQIANYDVCPFGLKIGRQELSYGDERLVGTFDWSNYARTFDAAKLTYQEITSGSTLSRRRRRSSIKGAMTNRISSTARRPGGI